MADNPMGLLQALGMQLTGADDWYLPAPYELPLGAKYGRSAHPPGVGVQPQPQAVGKARWTQVRCPGANYGQHQVACLGGVPRADVSRMQPSNTEQKQGG